LAGDWNARFGNGFGCGCIGGRGCLGQKGESQDESEERFHVC
jgi:hypothetical protein